MECARASARMTKIAASPPPAGSPHDNVQFPSKFGTIVTTDGTIHKNTSAST